MQSLNKNIRSLLGTTIIITLLTFFLSNCEKRFGENKLNLLNKENLVAWCIVPYDNINRDAIARATMLKELGISKFAYDWRPEHLENMSKELNVMLQNEIEISSVWFWVDGRGSKLFDKYNEFILAVLKDENIKTDLWIGVPEEYFGKDNDSTKLKRATDLIDYTYKRAKEIGCTISLYNHGGWFGEPKNQVKIIEELGYADIGMVYNFHHAHDQIKDFPQNLKLMKSHLRCVNINGMNVNGPKILTVGEGEEELRMIKLLISEGYNGPIGIIGHIENVDVKEILEKNLTGVENIKNQLK